mmetsp:Transcript_76126/g.114624  ORF Transcript_76126/g.114624 Transcript_76126/m.114624 type:complete len:150 (-) Transcript_76126:19-468(-)
MVSWKQAWWMTALVVPACVVCSGASTCTDEAACRCMLRCGVFGAAPGKCKETDKSAVVRAAVRSALLNPTAGRNETKCSGISCIVRCSHDMGCLTDHIRGHCEEMAGQLEECSVDCSPSHGGVGARGVPLLAVVLAAAASHVISGSSAG